MAKKKARRQGDAALVKSFFKLKQSADSTQDCYVSIKSERESHGDAPLNSLT